MINKINRIYSIFNEDVVISANTRINAIEGYDVINKGEVLSLYDVIDLTKNNLNLISKCDLYLYENPASGEKWYIGRNLIAHLTGGFGHPVIEALYDVNTLLVNSIYDIAKYKELFANMSHIEIVRNIGMLSYPNSVRLNYSRTVTPIVLPLRIV